MTKQQQIEILQKKLDAANRQVADVDSTLREQYLNIATNIISEIKYWFIDYHDDYKKITYDDIFKYLDNLRTVVEAAAPKYTPSVLCELSLSLAEARRQLAEQRIQAEYDKRVLKDRLNRIYGSGALSKTPSDAFGQEVINYVLQKQSEDKSDETK